MIEAKEDYGFLDGKITATGAIENSQGPEVGPYLILQGKFDQGFRACHTHQNIAETD